MAVLGAAVALFDLPLTMEVAFYLVHPEVARDRPTLAAFRDWMLREAAPLAMA